MIRTFHFIANRAASLFMKLVFGYSARMYVVGTAVTVFLSNDATAVVLTPAVYAATRAGRVEPLPYLFVCAFIANAASFVLPISNPSISLATRDRISSAALFVKVTARMFRGHTPRSAIR